MLHLAHLDMLHFARTLGYIGITAIIFVETGFFFGFFFPGDSLLFTAGLLASQGIFNIFILFIFLFLAAITGYWVAYHLGLKFGAWLQRRPDSIWFKRKYLEEARQFYSQHGGKALIIGRLLPVVRTFVPIVAGMTRLGYKQYMVYNLVGALLWIGGIMILGYTIGEAFPHAYDYIYPIIVCIIIVSLLPTCFHLGKSQYLRRK